MKNIKIILIPMAALFFTLLSPAQNDFNFKKDHDALQVKDLERAALFYKEIMKLKEIDNAGLGDHIRWFQLNDKVQIHLIQSDEEIDKNKGVHFAINTDKLEEFMQFLKSKNVLFENWPGEKETTNARPDGVRQIYLQDPDGYWIEVNDGKI